MKKFLLILALCVFPCIACNKPMEVKPTGDAMDARSDAGTDAGTDRDASTDKK
jgi:hypothetical protein